MNFSLTLCRLTGASGFRGAAVVAVAVLLELLAGCSPPEAADTDSRVEPGTPPVSQGHDEPILPIPAAVGLDARKVALGDKLFHETALSGDGTVSCATCHPLTRGGADGRRHSVGVSGALTLVNTPTVYNSSLNFRQFWDGRAESLETQVDGPLVSPSEMASTWPAVLAVLRQDPAYFSAFAAIYANGLSPENVRDTIAEFERSLVTPNSRFDRYLRGNADALSVQEKAGYAKFKNYGCVSCHQGVNVGANMFQRMGVMGDYFADRGHVTTADFGRFNATGKEIDRYYFKVPSLRNVALTAPYFHDGSAPTLEAAVTIMAKYQLGRVLPPEDLSDIVLFLRTLTGENRYLTP